MVNMCRGKKQPTIFIDFWGEKKNTAKRNTVATPLCCAGGSVSVFQPSLASTVPVAQWLSGV